MKEILINSATHHPNLVGRCVAEGYVNAKEAIVQADLADFDEDGVINGQDNCPFDSNWSQADQDGDGVGNACDNCALVPNPAQENLDGDGFGDECDADDDGDAINDGSDNCPSIYNPGQEDLDEDGLGDVCDECEDKDGDGFYNNSDVCGGAWDCDDDASNDPEPSAYPECAYPSCETCNCLASQDVQSCWRFCARCANCIYTSGYQDREVQNDSWDNNCNGGGGPVANGSTYDNCGTMVFDAKPRPACIAANLVLYLLPVGMLLLARRRVRNRRC